MSLWEALDLALSDSMSSIYTGAIIILPIIFFVFICFKYESNTQLFWAFIFRMVVNYDSRRESLAKRVLHIWIDLQPGLFDQSLVTNQV